MSDFMARLAIRNALFFGRDRHTRLLIPWATYTDPEIAHVGLYPRDLEERGIAFATFERCFADVDRTLLAGETAGFVKIHVEQGSDKILGATIVGEHASDMISEISVAMQAGMGLGRLAAVIHPYPTAAEAIRQCGDAYNRTRLTPTVRKIFHRLMSLQR
jgi:pyruvate/2-oxoglutarate dehydrogenase complex dihydrolipoamide dehydrogenase (E3) component